VVVVGSALLVVVPQPAIRMQMTVRAIVAVGWRKSFLPIAAVSKRGAMSPHNAAREDQ
jgi:hypothetical protein